MTKTTFFSIFIVFIIALIPSISWAEDQLDSLGQSNITLADMANAANPALDPNAARQGNSNGAYNYNDNAALPGANDDESSVQGSDDQDNLGMSGSDLSNNGSGY